MLCFLSGQKALAREMAQSKLDNGSMTAAQGQGGAAGGYSETPPDVEQLRQSLQRFCDHRGARLQVNEADARRVQAAWNNRDATGTELHTLLQAGLAYADAGMHHARRLADQWRGFYTACTQGEGKRLGPGVPHAADARSPPLPETATGSEAAKPREDGQEKCPNESTYKPPKQRPKTKT